MARALSKLTLALEASVIKQAKSYARSRETSISRLVEDYFRSLTEQSGEKMSRDSIPPKTRELMGVLKDRSTPDVREEISTYIRRKYR